MRRSAIIVASLFAVCMIANALWTWRLREGEPETHAINETPSASPRAVDSPHASPGTAPKMDAPAADCSKQLSTTKAELAALKKERDSLLPMPKRFESGKPNSELEARYRASIDHIFAANDAGTVPYSMECRDEICHLQIAAQNMAYMEELQGNPALPAAHFSFTAPTPANDAVTGEAVLESNVYLEAMSPEDQAAIAWLRDLAAKLPDVPAIQACLAANTPISLLIKLTLKDGTLSTATGGDGGATPTGRCVTTALADLVATAQPPPAGDAMTFVKLPH